MAHSPFLNDIHKHITFSVPVLAFAKRRVLRRRDAKLESDQVSRFKINESSGLHRVKVFEYKVDTRR